MSAREDLLWSAENGMTEDECAEMLDAYRAEVLREAADRADAVAMEMRECDGWAEEMSSREVMDAVQAAAHEIRKLIDRP